MHQEGKTEMKSAQEIEDKKVRIAYFQQLVKSEFPAASREAVRFAARALYNKEQKKGNK